MLTTEEKDKQSWLETFNNVTALYMLFIANPRSLRTKQATYRQDEVEALPIDFKCDVEVKARRVVGHYYYEMFTRLALIQEVKLLPEDIRLTLGQVWKEYGLGTDGAYARLYYNTNNEQIRRTMKENNDVRIFGGSNENLGDTATGSNL